jgi:hypothetical protein
MTPEELIQQLGPGTDGAVCVQKLLDQIAGVKDHVKKAVAEDAVVPKVAMADTSDDEKDDDKKEKEGKPPHTPYRSTKHG